MAYSGPERRLYPRWTVRDGIECRLQTRTRVRLIDISEGGALLAVDRPLPVGTPAIVQSSLGNAPFVSEIEIRRAAPGGGGGGRGALALGAIFVSMDDQSRRCLKTFLSVAGS